MVVEVSGAVASTLVNMNAWPADTAPKWAALVLGLERRAQAKVQREAASRGPTRSAGLPDFASGGQSQRFTDFRRVPQAFIAPRSGGCYHLDDRCRGLANASWVRTYSRCADCAAKPTEVEAPKAIHVLGQLYHFNDRCVYLQAPGADGVTIFKRCDVTVYKRCRFCA